MPRGKRTRLVTWRDYEVLEWIARYGMVPRSAVSVWAKTKRSVTLDRERRLREAGLIEAHPVFDAPTTILTATRRGLRACDRTELHAQPFSLGGARHSMIVAHVAAHLELAGEELFSEREITAEERWLGERVYSAERSSPPRDYGGYHRPDLIRFGGPAQPDAIEVELTNKAPKRLELLLHAWGMAVLLRKVSRVFYLCPPETASNVEKARRRIPRAEAIEILPLTLTDIELPRPTCQPSGGPSAAVKGRRPDPRRGLTAVPPPLPSRVGWERHPAAE
jgi:hypothetical protein